MVLGGIAFAGQAVPHIPTLFSVAWNVCRLSRSCTLVTLLSNKLETVDEEKNLGVIVSKDLKWDKFTEFTKATRITGGLSKHRQKPYDAYYPNN